ncbi:uncharacterized protein LACBIDRAFT_295770 [Laccaria bicolor S238N-H82]|uniref:Predicted protein n=1 Tax=Laccaria bicolor (strain S238N-H82 / ATCC MYA-4686) TaxID=486041 RepID=B0DXY6_LACBS|nr:uncharacterized protein LACBIDRAFT_295770 [Laccaria bicolor S238N-H82]EDR00546.1 predicted protein [Laccaria bicolor S238N-H82]|eukprot:XP_001888773.1 predicted protein [Laccaria bicolor S238N-H82]
MSDTASPTTTLTSIVSNLGGPRVNPSDIEWANDITSGKLLINWLVAQLDLEAANGNDDLEIRHRAALRDVALEDEELKILAHVKDGILDSDDGDIMAPADYLPPSHLKKRAEYMNNETELLQQESDHLKIRLVQAKKASQKMSQTLKTLQSSIKDINSQIEIETDVLDNSIASTKARALALLDALNHNSSEVQNTNGDITPTATRFDTTTSPASTATLTLSSLADTRATIIGDLSHYQETGTRKKLPEIGELQSEAQRLEASIENIKANLDCEDSAFLYELEKLCEQVESGVDVMVGISERVENEEEVEVDVYTELVHAWALDQAAMLQTRSDALDEALALLGPRVLAPLEDLHESLSMSTSHAREAEVLLRTLAEELEDLLEDADVNTRRESMIQKGVAEDEDDVMERELVKLFKELKDLRAPDAPLLVVLNRADVLAELEYLVDRARTLQGEGELWVQERLLPSLTALPRRHHPLLSAIYAHSPMNTSLPFTFPPPLEALRHNGGVKAEELQAAVVRLQKEYEKNLLNPDEHELKFM